MIGRRRSHPTDRPDVVLPRAGYQCVTWRSNEALWTNAYEHGGTESADVLNGLGLAYVQQGRLEEAEKLFAKAVSIEPDSPTTQNNMGLVLLNLNKLDLAMPHFLEAMRLKPGFANAYNNLGMVLARQGDRIHAAMFFRQAVGLKPSSPEMHNNLGRTLLEDGDAEAAIPEFNEAIRIRPDYAKARRNLKAALALLEKRRCRAASIGSRARRLTIGSNATHGSTEAQASESIVRPSRNQSRPFRATHPPEAATLIRSLFRLWLRRPAFPGRPSRSPG